MNRFKRFLTHLIIALGGVIFLSATTCPRYEDRDIYITNDSDAIVYAMAKVYYHDIEYDFDRHPANRNWIMEINAGETIRYTWRVEEDFWDQNAAVKVWIISRETYDSFSLDDIIARQLFEAVLTASGPELEANGFHMIYQ